MPTTTVTVDTNRDYSQLLLDERLDFCDSISEDTELGEAIYCCGRAAQSLSSINEPELAEMLCAITEKLCEDVFNLGDMTNFNDNTPETIKHFTGIDYQPEDNTFERMSAIVKSLNEKELATLKTLI